MPDETADMTHDPLPPSAAQPLSKRRTMTYCDECQLFIPCHKYDAPYRAEEVLYLCAVCVLEVQP
jgi:hypothetical protein